MANANDSVVQISYRLRRASYWLKLALEFLKCFLESRPMPIGSWICTFFIPFYFREWQHQKAERFVMKITALKATTRNLWRIFSRSGWSQTLMNDDGWQFTSATLMQLWEQSEINHPWPTLCQSHPNDHTEQFVVRFSGAFPETKEERPAGEVLETFC